MPYNLYVTSSNGDVRINWSTITKNGTTLKTGDVVSVSGKGRLKVSFHNFKKKKKKERDCMP